MKATILIFGLCLIAACNGVENDLETPASAAASGYETAPLPDANERHAAVTFSINERGVSLGKVKVGSGPARSYPRENSPIVIEWLDRSGEPFDQIVIDDPRQLRTYGNDPNVSTPHGT